VISAITKLPCDAGTAALTADGEVRENAEVAEGTGLLDPSGWPAEMRVMIRRKHPHPGAQLNLFGQHDGYRYQASATKAGLLAFLEARHRAHARVEDRIKNAKTSVLDRFPSREYAINHAWVQIVAVAADLTAWLQFLALDGELAHAELSCCGSGCCTFPAHPQQATTTTPSPSRLAMS
jgi:hypothetical protein